MKCNTQNEKIESITEKTLVVGIDVGSEMHYCRAFNWRGKELSKKPLAFSNNEAGFETFSAWIEGFKSEYALTDVVPGMEPTGHYWFNLGFYLQNKGMKPVHVNPFHVKRSKELDDSNPNKNDRKDPKVIAKLVLEGRFSYPYIPTGVYAEIRNLYTLSSRVQEETTRILNRIARWISIYFPEFKDVYRGTETRSGFMVLKVAPLPADIVKIGAEGVNKIWRDVKLRGVGLKRAQTLASMAEHSIGSKEASASARIEIKTLINDYETMTERMSEITGLIDEQIEDIKYIDKLLNIKGVGKKTVVGFIAEVGDISRFDDARQLQKLAGLAIVDNSSGKHKGDTRISHRGRKRLRHIMFEAALSLVGQNDEFRQLHEYYTCRLKNPLKKMQSLIAISCKAIRIFYKILTTGVDYDAGRFLGDINRPEEYSTIKMA